MKNVFYAQDKPVLANNEKMYIEIIELNNETSSDSDGDNRNEFVSLNKKIHIINLLTNAKVFDCVLLYGFIQGYMEQLFPANYSLFVNSLAMDPVLIGTAAFLQKVVFTIASPFWGLVIDNSEQVLIMKFSIISLTISTLLICFSRTVNQLFFSMCFWGFFSAVFGPISQKIASDYIEDNKRGKYFGKLMFYQSIGRLFALSLTGICSRTNEVHSRLSFFGYWIFPFIFATIFGLSLFIYLDIFLTAQDANHNSCFKFKLNIKNISNVSSMGYVLRSKTVLCLFLLGMVNAIPRSALNFVPMWLQSTGLSHSSAAFIVSASWLAAILISPIIGFVSDLFFKLSPSKGRIIMAQSSLIFRSIFLYFFIAKVPFIISSYAFENHKVILFSLISFIIGLFAGWPGIGACRPIFCEVILPQHRATVFALSYTFEGIGAAFFGTRFVGDLAISIFGYKSTASTADITTNHTALGSAILCMTIIPWMLSIMLFYFVSIESRLMANKTKSISDIVKSRNSENLVEIKAV
ncbi:membrane associated transporter [Cryptosporidium bovis]|uniref:membrane associated transporter n=1 Tax=Cryptosporidium bovis TaxID=310047 RepID=UPI00351AABF5|nr:membrane associated transporter [Cryptosporidium bovis]